MFKDQAIKFALFILTLLIFNKVNGQTNTTLIINNIKAYVAPNTSNDSLIIRTVISINSENNLINNINMRLSTDSLMVNSSSRDISITKQNGQFLINEMNGDAQNQTWHTNYVILDFKILNDKAYKWLKVNCISTSNITSNNFFLKFKN